MLFFLALPCYASSGQYFGQSVLDMGQGYSGGAALANDASTNYTNPAGLIRLSHSTIELSSNHVWANNSFTGTLSQKANDFTTQVKNFQDVDNGGKGLIPGFHAVAILTPDFAIGLSGVMGFADSNINSASLLKDSVSNMSASYLDFTPDLAFKFMPHWSLGGGADVIVSNSKDHFYLMNNTDYANIKMSGVDCGWNMGVLYFTPVVHFGLAYRSGVTNHLSGKVATGGALMPFVFSDGRETGETQIPPEWRFSALYNVSRRWRVMSTVYYTQWQQAERYIISAGDDASKSIYYSDHFNRNTLSLALGSHFQFSHKLGFSFGLIYDPQLADNHILKTGSNKGKRVAEDNNSIGVTVGARYQRNKKWIYALSCLYVFPVRQNIYNSSAGQMPIQDGVTDNNVFEVAFSTSRLF